MEILAYGDKIGDCPPYWWLIDLAEGGAAGADSDGISPKFRPDP
ncbi:hypothetical protein ACVWZ8_004706 [Arthrobacter sp. UYCu723]